MLVKAAFAPPGTVPLLKETKLGILIRVQNALVSQAADWDGSGPWRNAANYVFQEFKPLIRAEMPRFF